MAVKPVSVITTDDKGVIKTFNEGAEKLFGWKAEEVINKKNISMFYTGEAVIKMVPVVLGEARAKKVWEGQTPLIRKNGTVLFGALRVTPIYKDNELVGYCGVTEYLGEGKPENTQLKLGLRDTAFKWMITTRAPFFTAVIIPILLGTAIAYKETKIFDPFVFVIALAIGLLLHAGTNMINDYFDMESDERNVDYVMPYTGGSRALQIGLVKPQKLHLYAIASFALGVALSAYLALTRGYFVLILAIIGTLSGYLYSAPPIRLASRGIGELFVGLNFGILATAGAYYVQVQAISPAAVFAGIPVGLLIAAVLYINEFPDKNSDEATGKRTLIVRLGKRTAILGYALLIAASYFMIILGPLDNIEPATTLIALLPMLYAGYILPLAMRNYADARIKSVCSSTIYLHLITGLLLALSFLI